MTAKEFNRDFWVILSCPTYRKPIGYPTLKCLLGVKFDKFIAKVEQNKNQKLIVRPFRCWEVIVYRH